MVQKLFTSRHIYSNKNIFIYLVYNFTNIIIDTEIYIDVKINITGL